MKKTVQELATEMSAAFEGRTRLGGEEFRTLTDDAPAWMTDVCFNAHDGGQQLPDDWRYRFIEEAVVAIARHGLDDGEASGSLQPDIRTAELTGWLTSSNSRVFYLDEALARFGPLREGFNLLAAAQMIEKEEVFHQVAAGLGLVHDRQQEQAAGAPPALLHSGGGRLRKSPPTRSSLPHAPDSQGQQLWPVM